MQMGHTWLEVENCDAFDCDKLLQRLSRLAVKHNLAIQELGTIDDEALVLMRPQQSSKRPHILIAAGFHGDEPAGCWGIVRFLERAPKLSSVNISFLPLVNPTGFRRRQRTNLFNQDPNRGFFDRSGNDQVQLSPEGEILLKHLPLLMSLATHSFLSLHEDVEYANSYLYTFEASGAPGKFSQTLRDAMAKFFELFPDGPLEGGIARDGIIFGYHDGSFEDLLFHKGIPLAASTESPGVADINHRVEANAGIIAALAEFASPQPL